MPPPVQLEGEVQLQPVGHSGVDELEEAQELLVAVPPLVLGDDRPAGDVQGWDRLVVLRRT
jgi:hypothetical protein